MFRHVHHILHAITSSSPSSSPTLLILAHKADLLRNPSSPSDSARALAINRVKTILERELEKRRAAQANSVGIEGLGEEGERTELGGLECSGSVDSPFKFDEWEGGEVTFLSSWVKVQGAPEGKEEKEEKKMHEDQVTIGGLENLTEWLEEYL